MLASGADQMMIYFVAMVTLFCLMTSETTGLDWKSETKGISKCGIADVTGKPSYLWEITSPGSAKPSYLFGTIHVPYHEVWSLVPDNSKNAFYNCDTAVFEINFEQDNVARSLRTCQNLPQNITLQDVIPESLYERIERHFAYVRGVYRNWISPELLQRTGLSPEDVFDLETANWRSKKPSWIAIIIQQLTKWLVKNRTVTAFDIYLTSLAKRRRKTIESIETVQEQCDVVTGLNKEQTLYSLEQTLSLYEKMQRDGGDEMVTPQVRDLIAQYTCLSLDDAEIFMHNMTKGDSVVTNDTRIALQISKYMHDSMVERNVRMSRRIDKILTENLNKSYFFAFGGGHFFGETSVQNELKKRGYRIDRQPAVFNRNSYTQDSSSSSLQSRSSRKINKRTRKRSSGPKTYKSRRHQDKSRQNWNRYWTGNVDVRNQPIPASSSGTFVITWGVVISGLATWYCTVRG